jgi:uncharacterized protein YukE
MPTWTPNWTDVQFDHAAAHEYSATCRRTSAEVRRIAFARNKLAEHAVVDWEGPHRVTFDHDTAQWSNAAEDVAMQLESIAAKVDAAAATARQMQSEREQSRQRWAAESTAERLASERAQAEELAASQESARALTGLSTR